MLIFLLIRILHPVCFTISTRFIRTCYVLLVLHIQVCCPSLVNVRRAFFEQK